MKYVKLFAKEDGSSAFEDAVHGAPREMKSGLPPFNVAGPFTAQSIMFVEQTAEVADDEVHVAPSRQWLIVLTGGVEITVTDGETRTFGPGDVLLVEDTTGVGHLTKPFSAHSFLVIRPAS